MDPSVEVAVKEAQDGLHFDQEDIWNSFLIDDLVG